MRTLVFLLMGTFHFGQISGVLGQDLSALVVDVSAMGDGSISQARLEAQRQARSGGLPFRSFTRGEIRTFVGQYTPPELPEDKKDRFIYGLALFSDDGCNLTLKGSSVHARFGRGQHLPNLGESFHVLPVALAPGETVDITIDYRNTIYAPSPGQPPDIDGLTLFLYLIPVAIAVDANRDGDIVFEGDSADTTSSEKPFRFWINDDDDGTSNHDGEQVGSSRKDYEDGVIRTIRDLEDFSRVHIQIGGLHEAIANGQITVGLKWKDTSGAPAIKLYSSASPDGSDNYLRDEGTAIEQTAGDHGFNQGEIRSRGDAFFFPTTYWSNVSDDLSKKHFIFEGSGEGKGQICLTFKQANGEEIVEVRGPWLDLRNVRQFYERVRAIGEIPAPHGSITTPSTPSVGYVLDRPSGDVRDDSPASWLETNEFIIFVNGWNTSYDQARTFFAETMFKRLWQRGYRGRFAAFYWPTLTGPDTYNESEYRAWFFGESLKQYASSLSSEYNPSLIAHSMGNIVGGSAFLKGMHLQRYALINAAVPASCYDPNPALQQPYGNTPDHDSDPLTQALAYKNRFAAISTTLINFYLQSDDALELWALNNQLYKPQPFITSTVGDHGYKYFPGNPPGQKLFLSFILNASRTLQQMEESLAYAARSSTKVVGAEGNARGPISKENSIDLARFGYADEHSGFWAFSLQKMATAYDLLMDKLRVERSR